MTTTTMIHLEGDEGIEAHVCKMQNADDYLSLCLRNGANSITLFLYSSEQALGIAAALTASAKELKEKNLAGTP